MLKKITSKIPIVILIFVIIAGSFLAIIYLPVYNQSKINNLILKDVIFLDDKSVDNTQLKPQIDKNKEYKIVPLNDNWKRPLNPIFSIVSDEFQFNDENKSKGIRITVYELKRSNIFDQNFVLPQLPKYNVTKDLSFTDTVNLASRYDLTTSFPNKENYKITNYEPLSQEQIENNRKLRERDEPQPLSVQYENCIKSLNMSEANYKKLKNGENLGEGSYTLEEYPIYIAELKKACETLRT